MLSTKRIAVCISASTLALSVAAGAASTNIIRLGAPVNEPNETWSSAPATYTDWENLGEIFGCLTWAPDATSIMTSQTLAQQSTDCHVNQQRYKQNREQNSLGGEIRNAGEPTLETRLANASAYRDYTVAYSTWSDSGSLYGCSNWSPDPANITWGESFTQQATDCKRDQVRARTDSYSDLTGTPVVLARGNQTQTLSSITDSRQATGLKDAWVAADPSYTAWADSNALYACATWLPSPASVTTTQTFTQQALDCKTDQQRMKQEREQQLSTQTYRNAGDAVAETKTLNNQSASRSYTVTVGTWANNGSLAGCSNWSPDPSTVASGTSFTQTATDCSQAQLRSRVESYVDHKSASTVSVSSTNESQTLSGQTSTRSATGTQSSKVCMAKVTNSYQIVGKTITMGALGPVPYTYVYWAGTNVAAVPGTTTTVTSGGYVYTVEGSNVCRTPQ